LKASHDTGFIEKLTGKTRINDRAARAARPSRAFLTADGYVEQS
jgi:hypothetical protein